MSSATFFAQMIQQRGELLTVTVPSKLVANVATGVTTGTAYFQPQPINIQQAKQFGAEGSLNYLEDKPHSFFCAIGTTISGSAIAAGMRIAYNGESYKILTVTPYRLGAATLALNCVATLYKAGS